MAKNTVQYFRGELIPNYVDNKTRLIKYVLKKYRDKEPISNAEFVFDLRCTRFGGVLHDLRDAGWQIETIRHKDNTHFMYYLVSTPDDDSSGNNTLRLV
tara:strand:- start:329 stop:625 length:297 start_codon:yes stop_codon:yes gene_type:complete